MTPETGYRAAFLAVVLFLAPVHSHGAEGSGQEGVTFVSPRQDSIVLDERVTLAGRLPSSALDAAFLLNGDLIDEVRRSDSFFWVFLAPIVGLNEIEVRVDGRSHRLTFTHKLSASGWSPFLFHKPLAEGSCNPCHPGRETTGDTELCYQCHGAKAVMYPYVHGPVAAGKCLICHDPHGSSLPALTRSETKEMCTFCHDQLSTAQHTSGRTRVCTICHNPHYSMKRFLLKGSF